MSDKMAADYTVLIVDDVPTNVMLVQAILKKEGYTLLTANSGKKALEMTDVHNPNLILLDIMMPEMDGYEALQKIKNDEKIKNIPVIAITAQAMTGDREKCLAAGANGYVSKPVNVDELMAILNKIM